MLYNRFLVEPIGNAPTTHLIFNSTTYLGSPYNIISSSVMFTKTPEKDILDLEELAEIYEATVEELLKNKPYRRNYAVTHVEKWYYPIPEEKYLTNKLLEIRELNDEHLSSFPVSETPRVELAEYPLSENTELVPTTITISETIDGISTIMEIQMRKNKIYAQLIPPDLGMSTIIFFEQHRKDFKNKVLRELVEEYLDGLYIPEIQKIKTKGEKWEGKRAMLETTYVEIIGMLQHKHKNVYSQGCESLQIHFYSE